MDFEKVTHPSLLNDDITRNILSFPKSWEQEKTQWDKTVERMQKVELKAQEDLKTLKELSVPESVHRAFQTIKKMYGYQPYLFNDEVWVYDGMKVEWDKNTEKIQSIALSVKVGNRTLQFLVSPEGSYDIRSTYIDDEEVWVGYENNKKYWIRIWTKDWKKEHPIDATDEENYRKILPKRNKVISWWKVGALTKKWWERIQSWKTWGIDDIKQIPIAIVEKNTAESARILTEHFAGISRIISWVDVVQVYGRRSQDGKYEMVFDIKDSQSIIVWQDDGKKNYKVSVSKNGERDDSSDFASRIIIWWKENKMSFQNNSISLAPTERQKFLDRYNQKMNGAFSLNPWSTTNLIWNETGITLDQAKVIEAFENQEVDFWGSYWKGKIRIDIHRIPNFSILLAHEIWLQRENKEGVDENDYFVIIVRNADIQWSPIQVSIKRSGFLTSIFWTTSNSAEERLIQQVRDRLNRL